MQKWNSAETAATTLEIGGWLEERGVHVYVQLEDAEAESNSELARRFDRFDANSRSRTDRAVSITRSDSGTRLNLVAVSEEFGSPTASSASGGKPLLSKTPGQLKRSSGEFFGKKSLSLYDCILHKFNVILMKYYFGLDRCCRAD